ncbi:hypothetical protein ACFCX4_19165 [Kitasatospora sp. NPDC056327]|uniref:hypothetical protein n=1 Tax=Kitasatospora sp. NPDC056327 TaxID=3345785 RepID=UPI0035DDABC2
MRPLIKWVICLAVASGLGVGGYVLLQDDEPFTVYGYRAMCEKPRGFDQAAPHAASGPRPVVVSGFWNVRDESPELFDPAALDIWDPTDPAKVQLVACVEKVGRGEFVKSCDYEPDPFGVPGGADFRSFLYKATYRVTVYEARTGKLLASPEFAGDRFRPEATPQAEPCPRAALTRASGPRFEQREAEPYVQQIRDALQPHVTG